MALGSVNLAMMDYPVDSPRDILVSHLESERVTPVDFARRARVPFEVIDQLLRGEYPRDPMALQVIGMKLKQPKDAWARRLAAGLTELSEPDAAAAIHGQLWAYLIRTGLSIEAAAKSFGVGLNTVYSVLRNGRLSSALATDEFFGALGLAEDDPLREVSASGAVDQALSVLLTRAVKASGKTIKHLSEVIGMDRPGLHRLVSGRVSTRLKPTSVPLLARELGLDGGDLASRIAKTWRSKTDCTGTLKYLVSRHLLREGIYQVAFAHRIGVSEDVFKSIYRRDTIPNERNLELIRAGLNASKEEISLAVRSQSNRRIAESFSYKSMGSDIPPVNIMIADAAARDGLTIAAWGAKHHVPRHPLQLLVNKGHVPRRSNVLKPLMTALGLDRVEFNIALRKMTEIVAPPQGDAMSQVQPTSAAHEALLRLHKQVPVQAMAEGCGVGPRYLRTILRRGLVDVDNAVRDRIRRYLRVDPVVFARMVEPMEDAPIEDDDELRLLSAYRKLSSENQYRLREIAGRMLAHRRFDTFVSR